MDATARESSNGKLGNNGGFHHSPSRMELFEAGLEVGGAEFAAMLTRLSTGAARLLIRRRAGVDSRPRRVVVDARTGLVESVLRI